jgi:putative addiction module component (TIGR02574 family)
MTSLLEQILQMSVNDRLELIDEIWRTLDETIDGLPLTEEQKRELDRRLAILDADPGRTKPWEQIRAELDERR